MKLFRTDSFKRDLKSLPDDVRERAAKAIALLAENPRHPSLRAKKMKGLEAVWEASVSMSYRITYEVSDDVIVLRRIGTHDILKRAAR